MGKRLAISHSTMTIAEGELEGLTITWNRSISTILMRTVLVIADDIGIEDSEGFSDLSPSEQQSQTLSIMDKLDELVDIITPKIIKWDLEDNEGTPIEPTLENIRSLDMNLIMELFTSFCGVIGELPKVQSEG